MRTNLLTILTILSLLFISCDKEREVFISSDTDTVMNELDKVNISLYGRLTDSNGDAVDGARVVAGNKNTLTDESGLWRINDAEVGATFGYVSFESPNHMHGSRTVYAEAGSTYRVDVELLSNGQVYTIDAASGGTVNIPGAAATVVFPNSAFAKTDETPITSGEVRVVAHYLDANNDATYRQMPGDLRALASDAQNTTDFTLLTTFGMLAVELTDASGAEIVLADGATATLTMPLSGDALANAPSSIPLWYFDEDSGVWREEGNATLQGNAYVGEVTHFSFWNCDIPTDYVTLCATFNIEAASRGGAALTANLRIQITSQTFGTTYGVTDSLGRVCGVIPAYETLIISVLGYNDCPDEIYSLSIGPFSDDVDLGTIIIPPAHPTFVSVTGTAECNGEIIENGAAVILQNGRELDVFSTNSNGEFAGTVLTCDSSSNIAVIIKDYQQARSSDAISRSIAPTIDFGNVQSCEQLQGEYVLFILDGESFVFDDVVWDRTSSILRFDAENTLDSSAANKAYFELGSINNTVLAVGSYNIGEDVPSNDVVQINAPNNPALEGIYDFSPTTLVFNSVATNPAEYTMGRIAPSMVTREDEFGNQTDVEVSVDFSWLYQR